MSKGPTVRRPSAGSSSGHGYDHQQTDGDGADRRERFSRRRGQQREYLGRGSAESLGLARREILADSRRGERGEFGPS